MHKKLLILIGILSILLIVLILIYINQSKQINTLTKNSNSKNIQKNLNPQDIKLTEWYKQPTPKSYNLNLSHDDKGNIIVNKVEEKFVWPAKRNKTPPRFYYKIEILDKNDRVIDFNYLPQVRTTFYIDPLDVQENSKSNMEVNPLKELDFAMPFYKNAKKIRITDETEKVLKELELK